MNSAPDPRRYDLDALRAAAMLLGILLHAGLSFAPLFPWPVQDERQSGIYGLLFAAIHGFRMPVFFVLSGFLHRHALAPPRPEISALPPLSPRVPAVPARAGDHRSRVDLDQRLGHGICS